VERIVAENPENVAKVKAGRNNVFGFFVGQVMKETKGQANPETVNRLLKERLGI
jgi:Asp-tRNA(Asn)/Glu-tRNA(Gln) amidotransferase B subunit